MGPLRRLFWRKEVPRPTPRRRFWAYATPILLVALVGLGFAAAADLSNTRRLPEIVIIILVVGSVLPVAVCLRWPVMAWRIAYPMMFLGVINAQPGESWPWNVVQILGFLVVLGRLAATQEDAVTIWATVSSLIPVFLFATDANAWGGALLLVAIAALGNIFSRRRRTRELLARSEELTELERARRAVLEERARIAREMHDVVAHHMSMIAVRAETAPYRVTSLNDDAKDELATIAAAARSALADMRRLLGALRSEDGDAPTAPQPGLADIGDLVTTARAAGVDVTFDIDGVPSAPSTHAPSTHAPSTHAPSTHAPSTHAPSTHAPSTDAPSVVVPEAVGLTAYRIVQEALANAARHAPGGPVTIDVRGFDDRLELTVRNKRTGPAGEGGGHGLIGMRERAALLGGELTAGPDRFDFVVEAKLPFGEAPE
jgi:signal transduction histidine kinase